MTVYMIYDSTIDTIYPYIYYTRPILSANDGVEIYDEERRQFKPFITDMGIWECENELEARRLFKKKHPNLYSTLQVVK